MHKHLFVIEKLISKFIAINMTTDQARFHRTLKSTV